MSQFAEPESRYSRSYMRERKRADRARRIRGALLVCFAVLLVAGAVALFFIITVRGGGLKVPEVVGLSLSKARDRAESAGLTLEVDALQDTSVEEDLEHLKVEEQDPKAGSSAEKGDRVTVRLVGLPDVPDEDGGEGPAEGSQPGPTQSSPQVQPGVPEQATAPQPEATTTGTQGASRTVCIDPGHSSNSPSSEIDTTTGLDVADNSGASGELEAMWALAGVVKQRLESAGYSVVLAKDAGNAYSNLRRRADIGNTCEIIVRLHFDPNLHALLFPAEGQFKEHGGSRVYVDPGVAASSAQLAQALFPALKNVGVARMTNDVGGTSNNTGPAYVGSVLARVPVVLIENDPAVVGTASGREQVADALLQGINGYFQTH